MNFKVIDEKYGTVQGYALVRSCEKKTSKNGSFYLDILLSDSDGEINAKVWDYKGDEAMMPVVNTVILVRGLISTYNNAPKCALTGIANRRNATISIWPILCPVPTIPPRICCAGCMLT